MFIFYTVLPPPKKLLFWLDITSKNITDFDNFGRPVKMMTGCGIKILQNLFIFFSASNSLQTDRRVIVLLLNTRCYLNAVWHPFLTSFQYVAGMWNYFYTFYFMLFYLIRRSAFVSTVFSLSKTCVYLWFTVLRCRCSSDDSTSRLRLLYNAVLSCHVHGPATSQISLLPHQPCPTVLYLLHYLHRHVCSASGVRRTSWRRLANSSDLNCVFSVHSSFTCLFPWD